MNNRYPHISYLVAELRKAPRLSRHMEYRIIGSDLREYGPVDVRKFASGSTKAGPRPIHSSARWTKTMDSSARPTDGRRRPAKFRPENHRRHEQNR